MLWAEYSDTSGETGSARWGNLTDTQIDAALAALTELLGQPDTTS